MEIREIWIGKQFWCHRMVHVNWDRCYSDTQIEFEPLPAAVCKSMSIGVRRPSSTCQFVNYFFINNWYDDGWTIKFIGKGRMHYSSVRSTRRSRNIPISIQWTNEKNEYVTTCVCHSSLPFIFTFMPTIEDWWEWRPNDSMQNGKPLRPNQRFKCIAPFAIRICRLGSLVFFVHIFSHFTHSRPKTENSIFLDSFALQIHRTV